MFSYIIGEIKYIEGENVILENNNIGYKLQMPLSDTSELSINESRKIYTEFTLRDDGVYLYGFISQDSHKLFLSLVSVSSVGPKAALSILSTLSSYEIKKSIMTSDIKMLSQAPGIGKKTASRIILELSDKIVLNIDEKEVKQDIKPLKQNKNYDFALEALINLGYQRNAAIKALESIDSQNMDLSQVVKEALKKI
ncbi:MAG: Holliday junction branch migration protein RuvA [Tissierellia bacterium]|nr:Holliday junction branch migration protein RuvA [Tissierellia bacterium]